MSIRINNFCLTSILFRVVKRSDRIFYSRSSFNSKGKQILFHGTYFDKNKLQNGRIDRQRYLDSNGIGLIMTFNILFVLGEDVKESQNG